MQIGLQYLPVCPALGRELINAQPQTDGCQLHEREIVGRKLVVASGDASTVLDPVEEPLDAIARTI